MKEIKELKKLAEPLQEWLASNYDPMCSIVIEADGIKVVRSELYTPTEIID